jgi:hypothetical protein
VKTALRSKRAWTALIASLLALQGPDGQAILVAPEHVVSLRAPRSHEHFAPGTRCILLTSDGRLVSVINRCADIRKMIEGGADGQHR